MAKLLRMSELDRISNLPDELLSRILSLLPTKCAVATSVLSTRWEFIWTSVTKLDFESGDYDFFETKLKSQRRSRRIFTRFVNRVLLLLNQPSIQDFSLNCSEDFFDPYYLKSWICAAFGRTVGQLDICVIFKPQVEFPMSRICCNVSVLKLSGNIHFNIPAAASVCFLSLKSVHLIGISLAIAENSFVSFPNLKTLNSDRVAYANEYSVRKLFSSCRVLDDLVVNRDGYDLVSHLIISIPSLTRLFLSSYDDRGRGDSPFYKIQIDTPSLQFLSIYDNLASEYLPTKNLSSLLEAEVQLVYYPDGNFEFFSIFNKFIECLSSVKSLSLLHSSVEVIKIGSVNILPAFHNLTRLELELETCFGLSVVNKYLESMDNLEHLVLQGLCSCWKQSWWVEPQNVPKCLLSRISTISFDCLKFDCGDQHELLRYFLKNGEVLQMLKLRCNYDLCLEEKVELLAMISMFPRGSALVIQHFSCL